MISQNHYLSVPFVFFDLSTFQTDLNTVIGPIYKYLEHVTLYNRKQFALPETVLKQIKQSVLLLNKIKIKFSFKVYINKTIQNQE